MIYTPRTDKVTFAPDLLRLSKTIGIPVEVVPADFSRQLERENAELRAKLSDYESVLEDKRRLTRELDVAMNGEEGAAKQARKRARRH